MRKINAAVIGVGSFGQHHARIYKELDSVENLYVVDVDEEKLRRIQKQYNIPTYTNLKDVIGKVDVASVVVPTNLHYEISKFLLENGIHCLVEKPMTTNLEQADELIARAKRNNLVLMAGHIERFNPAVSKLKEYVNEPKYIEFYRISSYDKRAQDVSVVFDLMIHDLDVVLWLLPKAVVDIEAFGARVISEHEDIVKVRLRFENGTIADFSASRLAKGRYRKLRIFQQDSYISVDYPTQNIKIQRMRHPNIKSIDEIETISIRVEKGEPLKNEITHFIDCVINNKKPIVDGEEARKTIEVTLKVLSNLKLNW